MPDGYWLVRLSEIHVYDPSLEEALASALRVRRYSLDARKARGLR